MSSHLTAILWSSLRLKSLATRLCIQQLIHTNNIKHTRASGWSLIGHKRASTPLNFRFIFDDVIMGAMASQNTSLTIVYSTVYSDANQRKHQCSASLAFVQGIHRGPVNSPHKWPVTRKMFPFHDVIMFQLSEMSQQVGQVNLVTVILGHNTSPLLFLQTTAIHMNRVDRVKF